MPFQVIAIIESTAVTFIISLKVPQCPQTKCASTLLILFCFLFSPANILTPHPYSCHEMKLWILTLEADILGTPVLRLVVRGPGTEVQRPHWGLWGSHAMAGHGGTLAVVAPQVKQAGVHVGVAGGRTRSIGGTGVHAAIQCFLRPK